MSDASERTRRLVEADRAHVWHPFTQMQGWMQDEDVLIIERAEGCHLIDTEGKRYLDGVSSLWTNVHGHRHAGVDQAIRAQLDRVAHSTLLGLGNVPSIELAERLVDLAPPGLTRVFYSDSGSTAVEVALKMAFQHQAQRGQPERRRFAALTEAYHGDTLGSVSVGGMELFHGLYKPLLFDVHRVPGTSLEALETLFDQHGEELAAFVLEPLIQGAAGMVLQPPGFLRRARALCDAHDVLLICDEVATGFGRTGSLFACEREGVAPDLLCLAKGLTAGYMPLAATLTTEGVFEPFLGRHEELRTFFHGHTYTGNPLACAAALGNLDAFASERTLERLGPKIRHLGTRLDEIAALPSVREVRQLGFMVGIELSGSPIEARTGHRVCMAARRHGVIVRPLGDVIVLMPPLAIQVDELDLLVDGVAASIREVT